MKVSNILNCLDGILDSDVSYFKFEFDEQKNKIDITTVPKKSIEYLELEFTVSNEGVEFNDENELG